MSTKKRVRNVTFLKRHFRWVICLRQKPFYQMVHSPPGTVDSTVRRCGWRWKVIFSGCWGHRFGVLGRSSLQCDDDLPEDNKLLSDRYQEGPPNRSDLGDGCPSWKKWFSGLISGHDVASSEARCEKAQQKSTWRNRKRVVSSLWAAHFERFVYVRHYPFTICFHNLNIEYVLCVWVIWVVYFPICCICSTCSHSWAASVITFCFAFIPSPFHRFI